MHNEELRNACSNALLTSGSYSAIPPSIDITNSINSSSIVCPEYVISDGLLPGQSINGRMSNVRRFFCLFVTFDLLFTSLMWLICIMLTGEDIWMALNKEIVHYNIHTTLFDIVLAGISRFTVLLLFYGFLRINHWIIICLSTAGTCAFLICKVFVFNWQDSPQPVFQVLLILTSFILSWGEAWFLDFRVIPQETQARQIFITSPDNERTPLIRSYVQGLQAHRSEYTESVGNFHSVQGSPSSNRRVLGHQSAFQTIYLSPEEIEKYKRIGEKAIVDSWSLNNATDWKLLKTANNDSVYVKHTPKTGRIYKLKAPLKVPAGFLFEELYYKVSNMPEWNKAVLESHKVQIIDDHTDVTYQISAPAVGGMIQKRDFVTLRRWEKKDNCHIVASVGIEFPSIHLSNECVRAVNGIGCQVLKAQKRDACQFEWVLNTDLNVKGIPGFVLEKGFVNMMFDYVKDLREHLTRRVDGII